MSGSTEDWRLQGQERHLHGAALRFIAWSSANPSWEHDHCAFCPAKFAAPSLRETLHEGYATEDRKHWVCANCFADFRARFAWVERT